MQYGSVPASALSTDNLSPAHCLKQYQAAYERRLVRFYRCHYLPHQICHWLDITLKQFGDDLQRLDADGQCLSYDARVESDFLQQAPPSTLSQPALQRLIDDNAFYQRCDLSTGERAKLLMLTRSRLRDLPQAQAPSADIDKAHRNAAIAQTFKAATNKRGLKASLAKAWGLSRKSIDLILLEQGVNPVITTSKSAPQKHSKAPLILAQYHTLKDTNITQADMRRQIAQQANCSVSYVIKVINEQGQ